MTILLIRLAGPMQSWGTQDRFGHRFTEREPSKSGVIGILCAALGRGRDVPVDDLAALRMGVRADLDGRAERDYQTAGGTHLKDDVYGVRRASGGLSPNAVLSYRYYLAGADFLVALEGPDELLRQLAQALRRPVWQLALGRKAFPPGVPVHLPDPGGLRPGLTLEQALECEPWPGPHVFTMPEERDRPTQLRFVIECAPGASNEVRTDQPIGAAFATRIFAPRYVQTLFRDLGTHVPLRKETHVPVTADP